MKFCFNYSRYACSAIVGRALNMNFTQFTSLDQKRPLMYENLLSETFKQEKKYTLIYL